MREQDAWLVFEDESGQALRPPKARTWSRIGVSPQVKVPGKGSGRVAVAGMVCVKPGERTRLIHRMLMHHPDRRGEKNGFRERDFTELLEAAHRQLGARIVLVRDNSTQHKDTLMHEFLAARERWLTVFRLQAYTPDLNPAEGVWTNLKNGLGNLAACTVDALADLTCTRLKKMQYRPDLLDDFIAKTGPHLDTAMTSPRSENLRGDRSHQIISNLKPSADLGTCFTPFRRGNNVEPTRTSPQNLAYQRHLRL
ncbi:MAG TPA: transposase [Streptomyces sp.]